MASNQEASNEAFCKLSYGTPMWIEIPAVDLQRARAFYAEVFDWTFPTFGREPSTESAMFKMPDERLEKLGTGGSIVRVDAKDHVRGKKTTHAYMLVDSIEDAMEKIQKAGGKQVSEKKDVGGDAGWIAQFEDPEGNLNGLYCNA